MRFSTTARLLTLIGSMALLAACGGSSETASTGATTAPTNVATTSSGTTGGSGSSAPAKATGGADACALLTVEEVARVMGAANVRAEGEPELAGATYCTYRDASGKPLVATSYLRSGATVFNAVAASMQPQSGLGDKAQWDATSATLQILKGSTMLAITAGDGSIAVDRRLDLARQLGMLGVARQ